MNHKRRRCAYRYLLTRAQDAAAQPAPGASKTHRPQHECGAFITPPRSVARLGTARTNLFLRSMHTLPAPWISAVQHRGGSDLSLYIYTLAPWISTVQRRGGSNPTLWFLGSLLSSTEVVLTSLYTSTLWLIGSLLSSTEAVLTSLYISSHFWLPGRGGSNNHCSCLTFVVP